MAITTDMEGTASVVVAESHLATAVRSGDVPVFATPMVVALCEEATVAAVAPGLDPGETTVGVRVDVEHMAPSVTGAEVVATARVAGVDGRRVAFTVEATDGDVTVARGTIHRVVVDRAAFVDRLSGS